MTEQKASCSRCPNRTDENPPFCTWLKAEVPPGLADDPECEGFGSKNLGTSKGKATTGSLTREQLTPIGVNSGTCHTVTPLKVNEKRVGKLGIEPSKTACPKIDKSSIQTALKLKGLKGSVVREKICCGKPGCHCHTGSLHGPYPYLHYYSHGKVKRRYLSKTVSALLAHSRQELENILHTTEA
jgi:hypothetical protein